MSEIMLKEIGGDHRHWLAEIERWEVYLRLWKQQQETLTDEIAKRVQEHGQQLSEHARMLDSLRHTIADCERALSIGSHVPTTLQTQHEMDSRLHEQQRAAHERIKAEHHRLMLAFAMLKGEQFREE